MSLTTLIITALIVLYFSIGIFAAFLKDYWTLKNRILYVFIWPIIGLL